MYYPDELVEEVRSRSDIVEVISGYVRLQKRGSTYFGLCPFHNEKTPSFSVTPHKQMYYCFGCGAGGNVFTFLSDTLKRIVLSLGGMEESYYAALASSFMLSADNAHVMHPNHPEYSDSQNMTFMNQGIVVKFNANQKYTTDAVSEAVFHAICEKAGVPVQHYANRSDLAGGGTLGNISGSHVSINTLDIGLAQLAMHSCYETAGVKDVDYMIRGMKAFYETEIESTQDGQYTLG